MKSNPNQIEPSDPCLENKSQFNVVIAYEDFAAAVRAKRVHESLIRELGRDFIFNLSLWKFDLLALPRLRELAAQDAAEAHLLIVSTSEDGELRDAVKTWLEAGLKQTRNSPAALVALSHGAGEVTCDSNPAHACLREIAFRHQLEFFAHALDEQPARYGIPRFIPQNRGVNWPASDQMFETAPSFARCGINE